VIRSPSILHLKASRPMALQSDPALKKGAPGRKPSAQAATIAAAVKKVPATVTLKGVVEEVAESCDMPKKQAHLMLEGMVARLTTHLKNGERVRMNGLGILEVKDRPARQGRNPATGEPIEIAASKKIAFRPAKELKEAV
jgi:DNA-binding protein HU-beta